LNERICKKKENKLQLNKQPIITDSSYTFQKKIVNAKIFT